MTNQLYFLYTSLRDFLEPLRISLSSVEGLESLCERYGWSIELDDATFDLVDNGSNLRQPLEAFLTEAESLTQILQNGGEPRIPEAHEVVPLASAAREVFQAIASFRMSNVASLPAPLNQADFWTDVGEHLLDDLLEEYLRIHYPQGYLFLHLFGVIRYDDVEPAAAGRKPYKRTTFDWDHAVDALGDPLRAFKSTYAWGDPVQDLEHQRMLTALEKVLRASGLSARKVPPDRRVLAALAAIPELTPREDEDALRITFLHEIAEGDGSVYEVGVEALPASHGSSPRVTGLVLAPILRGGLDTELPLGRDYTLRWRTAANASGSLATGIFPDGVEWTGGQLSTAASIEFSSKYDAPRHLLGNERTARIELSGFSAVLSVSAPAGENAEVSIRLASSVSAGEHGCRLIIPLAEADGFVKETLARESIELGFGGEVVWSSRTGISFDGRPAPAIQLPGTLKLGPIEVGNARLRLAGGDRQTSHRSVDLTAAADVRGKVGPVSFVIERLGFACRVIPHSKDDVLELSQERRPLLGNLDVDLSFVPPLGIGLGIDASGVVGGGALSFLPEKQEYAGVVQLAFGEVEVQALGLITSRLPGGAQGFSMMVMVTAEGFAPIDLGLGFRLTGIGGLLGINRTVAVDLLRSGLKNRTLDGLLFPEDPLRNATAIVTAARSVFPSARGQHFVGPVVEIVWGTNGLLSAQIGVVLEFPSPLRLILLGQMAIRVPSPQKPLVRINLDVLGTVDFDRGEALLLATLVDSRLLQWTVTGDAAFYLRWKDRPEFVLSVGGFHPSFPAPSQLPALDRLAMSLSEGDSVRMRMQWYLALTPNTLQHGSRVELHVSAIGFTVDGHLGYDALVQFDPFGFVIAFSVGVGLKWHGHTLASVQLDGTLSGPSPWHVRGKAKFRIWIFSKSIDFDRTVGRGEPLPPIPVVDPLPELVEALLAPASWESAPPSREGMVVTLRDVRPPGVVMLHPLGNLAVRQQVLPLGTPITRFGNARLAAERTFRVDRAGLGDNDDVDLTPLLDHFAPGQFRELSQSERLSRPSFEKMQAGLRIGTGALDWGGSAVATHRRDLTLAYETAILDDDPSTGEPVTLPAAAYTPPAALSLLQSDYGAAARSDLRNTGVERFRADHSTTRTILAEEPQPLMPT